MVTSKGRRRACARTATTKKLGRSWQARLVAKPILTSVKFTNKILDFCQIWLGEHKGPVRLSYIMIDSWIPS